MKKSKNLKVFLIGFILLSFIPLGCIWMSYNLMFNFEEHFLERHSSSWRSGLYQFAALSMKEVLPPFGRYLFIFLHLLLAYPFLTRLYRLTKNTFFNLQSNE